MNWTLYGAPISLFTRKLEAALEFHAIAFENASRDDSNRAELEARAGTHQIPVLATPFGWTLADSTPIIMWLDTLNPNRRLFPADTAGVLVHVIEEVLDEWVSRVMVHYRWHYPDNAHFVIETITGTRVTRAEALAHPLAQWGLRACRATGTENAPQQAAAESEYLGLIAALEAQLGQTRYALGDRPTAVDAALIGGLRGHTLHDPIPDLNAFPRVCQWALQSEPWDGHGELVPLPDSTPFAAHMLELATTRYRPFALANRAAREAGKKTFSCQCYGQEVSFLARAYPETSRRLLAQRVHHGVSAAARAATHDWLAARGLADCF